MTEDAMDATELKLKEIFPEKLVMEPVDAIHSFEFRLNDQKAKASKFPGGITPPRNYGQYPKLYIRN